MADANVGHGYMGSLVLTEVETQVQYKSNLKGNCVNPEGVANTSNVKEGPNWCQKMKLLAHFDGDLNCQEFCRWRKV